MSISLTQEQINKIRLEVKNKVLNAEKISTKDSELIECFKSKFTICEVAYKIMEQRIKKLKDRKNIKLNLINIKPNIKKLKYKINENLLEKLFGSKDIRGSKSIKKLRDALTHDSKLNDIEELKKRQTEIFNTMNTFLTELKK